MGKIQNIKLQNERLNTKNEQNNILMPSERWLTEVLFNLDFYYVKVFGLREALTA